MQVKNLVKFIFLVSAIACGQKNISPLDIPIKLSGTFGELRNTHFHTGIDIKTGGTQGLKVKAVKKGYLSRVRVSVGGYGKSLYINHYDGTTSVYAHLKKFSDVIEKYVKKIQYKNRSYEIQSFPEIDEITFDSGELIGYSGNTGSSSGPHLHFEIRNSKSNSPLNPLNSNLNIKDTINPIIKGIYLYKVFKNGGYKFLKEVPIKKISNDTYEASLIKQIGRIGIGINYYDKQDRSYSKNGAYHLNLIVNDNSIFNYKMNEISFNDKKFLKLLVDYENWYLNKNKIQKLFIHPKSTYSFMEDLSKNGIINLLKDDNYGGKIEINDYNGNKTHVILKFSGIKKDTLFNKSDYKIIHPNYEYNIGFKGIEVNFPKKTFFNPTSLKISTRNDTLDLGKNIHPINKSFEIKFQSDLLDSLTKAKGFISKITKYGKPLFLKTTKSDSIWSVNVSSLGKYTFSIDTVAPIISPINFKEKQWLSNLKNLKLKVKDELSGVKSIEGIINGQWVLFEYEPKNNTITYNFSDLNFPDGEHKLVITVEDLNGNKSEYQTVFFRKN
ncbi:MAG: hypothetical protein CMC04_10120 [Flavobacteriaceae bacterium]|nr:hypothetical protein [Flavobacteriaceae bacterium]